MGHALAETLIAGIKCRQMAGPRVSRVAEIQFMAFLSMPGWSSLFPMPGRLRSRTRGREPCPDGRAYQRHGAGITRQSIIGETLKPFCNIIPGLRVVIPVFAAARANGLLLVAIADPDPVIFWTGTLVSISPSSQFGAGDGKPRIASSQQHLLYPCAKGQILP